MPKVSDRHLRVLKPYLIGNRPKANGEWDMTCPLHEDVKRSASLNVLTGAWYCFGGCGGGGVLDLIRAKSRWVPPGVASTNGHGSRRPGGNVPEEIITEGLIKGWASALISHEQELDYLITERGIHTKTIMEYDIGWDAARKVYTIPIRGDKGEIWNVRRYTPVPNSAGTKIWSVKGMRVTELYPMSILDGADRIVIGEGEWDILLTIQMGFPAITRTSGAGTWNPRWNPYFKDKLVFIAQDRDTEGEKGSEKIARALAKIADVRMVELPYPLEAKHGKDLTDYWMEHDRADFESLLAESRPFNETKKKTDPEVITVLDSFDSRKVGDPVKLMVTIKGRKDPGYSIPKKARLTCTRDAGPTKCPFCPLYAADGAADLEISSASPLVLNMFGAGVSSDTLFEILRDEYGAVKCAKLDIEIKEHQAVEVLFGRPSIDHADGTKAREYKNVTITSVGRHDTSANNTVVATGALYPNPKDQHNDFLAWEIERQETSVDHFEITPESVKLMERFQPRRGQRPLQKLGEIDRALAEHVTHIVGRPEMHAVMDLTFHSVLSFKFGGKIEHRGWLESVIPGDTRTGKSEVAERLVRHFGAGEIVGGEAATLAGLVGGLQQLGGKDWAITWGVIPINDRRLVVIDELSGLHPEAISKMSDIRGSGIAKLTKVEQDITFARTRLIWLGNPRSGNMSQFTYGVDSLKPLIGNPEDIARFDIAMSVSIGDVSKEEINKPPAPKGQLRFTSEACHTLLMWVWTRQAEQIVWARGAEEAVYKYALEMGAIYVEDPPLVQAANIRIKIARVAAALAARTFSTDANHEKIVITKAHVEDAARFMNMLYGMPSFGYEERSREHLLDTAEAEESQEEIRRFLLERRGLAKLLRSNGRFRRQDLEEVLSLDRESANAIINKLWNTRMISKDHADNVVQPTLHGLLREIRW